MAGIQPRMVRKIYGNPYLEARQHYFPLSYLTFKRTIKHFTTILAILLLEGCRKTAPLLLPPAPWENPTPYELVSEVW
jgi:predicted small lipoprotein YifL